MTISVSDFNQVNGEVWLTSDCKKLEDRITELRSEECVAVARSHAAEIGLRIIGLRESTGRNIRFQDARNGKDIMAEVNTPKYQNHPEHVRVSRVVKLEIDREGGSSLAILQKRNAELQAANVGNKTDKKLKRKRA